VKNNSSECNTSLLQPKDDPQAGTLAVLTAVLDHTLMLAAYLDPAFHFIWVNRAYAAAVAEEPGFFIGKNHFDLYPNEENRAIFQRVVETGEPFSDTARPFVYPNDPDRKVTYWDWSLMPIKDETDRVTSLVLTLSDVSERIQTESRLRQSEEKYRLLAQNATDVIWTMNLDGQFTYFSPSIRKLTGFTSEEAITIPLEKILTPASFAKVMDTMREELFRDGEPGVLPHRGRVMEVEQRRRDGGTVWAEVTTSFLRNESGKPIGVIGITRDITLRREAAEALKHSEKKYRSLVEQSLQGLVITQQDPLRLSFVSGPVRDIFGYPPEEMMTFTPAQIVELIHPDQRAILFDNLAARYGKPDHPSKYEYQIIHRDGRRKWVEVFSSLIEFEGSQAVQTVLVDITEQKKTIEELQRSEARNAAMLATIPDLLFMFDDRCRVVDFKSGRPESLLLPPTQFIGKPVREILPPALRRLTEEKIRQTIATGQLQTYEYELDMPDRRRFFEARMTTCGERQVLAIVRDITDRKEAEQEKERLEQQLRQAMKMESIGRLAGGVAHDFNNILTGIIGYAEMIIAGLDEKDPLCDDIQEILGAGRRAAGLTAQLLAFSRKQIISPIVLQPNAALAEAQNMLRRIIGEDVTLVFNPSPDLGCIKADSSQLDQILINLVVNARDAMPDGGRLTIETVNVKLDEEFCRSQVGAEPGDYVMLAVSDSGCGMDAETQAKIFEPFFSTKDKDQGVGLGLATVYGIVQQNNGFISVSSAVGAGTTFKVYFPQVREEVEKREDLRDDALPVGDETILLVEDEEMVRSLARRILESQGYRVIVAADGGEALQQCREYAGEIHLLLTDVVMPQMNGRQLQLWLAENRPKMRTLFMSGYTDDVIGYHGILEDGIDFLQKPFTVEQLVRRVRQALDRTAEK